MSENSGGGFRKRRAPDPSKPGTVYHSKPKMGRNRGLSDGPPYLEGPGPGDVYRENGGPTPDPYGNRFDGYDTNPTPAQPSGLPPRRPYGPPPSRPGYPPTPGARRRFRLGPRRVLGLGVLVLVLYPFLLGTTAWTSLNRVDALDPAHEKLDTPDTDGRTFLVVGSDSRGDLTKEERKRLGTGSAAGQRTDTIMLLHVPGGGGPTALISIPRDSFVPIPGHSRNKINAAYAFGGPSLLVQTVESVSGLRIDEYVETGLGGFATIVDAVGGVTLCPKRDMDDPKAHIDLKKGCQEMDGRTALGYARARHSDPRGDLGRVERQRETLAAISKKTLSPATLVQPWRSFPAAKAGGGALTVDQGTTPIGLARFVLAMRAVSGGGGLSLTVPVGDPNLSTSAGSAVGWDRTEALRLFKALKTNDMDVVKQIAAAQKAKR
jgi:LCP family protein required for cell wall assembly